MTDAAAPRPATRVEGIVAEWIKDRGLLPAPSHVADLCFRLNLLLAERDAALNLCMDAFERMGEMSAQGKLDSDVWFACVKARTALQALAAPAAPTRSEG